MSIGEAAAAAGVTPDALRYYEREGLLPPVARDGSGRRVYDRRIRRQLGLVRDLRAAGVGIADVRAIVAAKHPGSPAAENAARVRSELERLRAEIAGRERALARARRKLDAWLRELDDAGL